MWKVFMVNKWHDEDDAEIDEGKNPEENAGSHCVRRSSFECVLDGKCHAEVAFHTDSSEAEGAVVNGHIEDKARHWAEDVRQVPDHVIHHFLHLKGQEDEEEQVWNGQVKEQDVDRCGFPSHFLAEGVERQDIHREAQDKGDDVDGQTQRFVALLRHGGLWFL